MLYSSFWVIPLRPNFIRLRFRTLCLFHLRRWCKLTPSTKTEQSVPKRRHIKFRCRGIAQKKEYNRELLVHVIKRRLLCPTRLQLPFSRVPCTATSHVILCEVISKNSVMAFTMTDEQKKPIILTICDCYLTTYTFSYQEGNVINSTKTSFTSTNFAH